MAKRKLLSIKATKQFEKEIERRWAVNQAIKEQVSNIIIQPSEVPYKKKIYGDIFQLPYTPYKKAIIKGGKTGRPRRQGHSKPPALQTIHSLLAKGFTQATDGCHYPIKNKVCRHGCHSIIKLAQYENIENAERTQLVRSSQSTKEQEQLREYWLKEIEEYKKFADIPLSNHTYDNEILRILIEE